VQITTKDSTKIQYFLTNSDGLLVGTGIEQVQENPTLLSIPEEQTDQLLLGANDLKIFALSDSVLKPDIFSTGFLVVDYPNQALPKVTPSESTATTVSNNNFGYIIAIGGAIIIGIILYSKSKLNSKRKVK